MSSKLLPDELWDEIEQLLPEYQPSPDGGRPPKEARQVLTAVLFVLKTGIGWNDLPTETFGVSHRHARDGSTSGPTKVSGNKIHELFLARLRGADLLDWSRVLVDCSLVKAPLGGPKPGRTRRIAAARAVSTVC